MAKSLLIKDTTIIHNFALLLISKTKTRLTNRFLLFFIINIISLSAFAQNENRRWAIDINGGPTFINNKTNYQDAFGVKNGVNWNLGAEYYIPSSHFSTKLGYKSETINLIGQDVQANQKQLTLGGRWYPAPEKWMIQPRVGVNMDVLLSSDNTSFTSGNDGRNSYAFDASIRSPKVTLSPTVGLDLYIFSSVALTLDYSYSLGINSKYEVYDGSSNKSQFITRGNLNHHNLNFGIKVTLPFHFNSVDASNLIQAIFPISQEKTSNKTYKQEY